jgi:hypothetical protein
VKSKVTLALLSLLPTQTAFAFLGSEMLPLMQLVSGQIEELAYLSSQLSVAEAQMQTLTELNSGINRVIHQIESIEAIVERSRGLDPTAVRSLSQLNQLVSRAKDLQSSVSELIMIRSEIAEQAIAQSAAQSDTAYRMGQEMTLTGAKLADESKTASPGRAAQISASASSAQMLAQGVELQTLSQMVQLQALSLDYQRAQSEEPLQVKATQQKSFEESLRKGQRSGSRSKGGPR